MTTDVDYVPSEYAMVGLRSDAQELLAMDQEPNHFVRSHEGHVTLYDGDGDAPIEIGRFRAFYIDAEGALCAGVALFDVFDCMSETYPYLALYDDEEMFTEAVRKAAQMDPLYEPNLLILDRLQILPRFRGRGYGLQALIGMMHWFSAGAGLVVMKPFPLQSEGSNRRSCDLAGMDLDKFPTHHTQARTKLRRYYARLGFKLVTKTQFMVRRVDQAPPSLPAAFD